MPRTGSVFALAPSTVAPAVAGTPASAADFNAAMADISQALTDSMVADAPAFTSPAEFDGGTEDAPGITFVGDLDTGIWHPAANQVGITVDGVVTGTVLLAKTTGVDITGDLTADGNLGVTGNADVDGNLNVDGNVQVDGLITAVAGVDASNQKIINLLAPTADTDAATKKYVDDSGAIGTWLQPTAGVNTDIGNLHYRIVSGSTVVFYGKITASGGNPAAHEVLFTVPLAAPFESFTVWGTGVEAVGAVEFNDYMIVTINGTSMEFSCARGLTAGDYIFLDSLTYQTSQ